MKKIFAFSLVELLISLIVISCITAAFTPVITKKLKTSAVSLNAASSEITTECSTKFSSSCKLCTKSYCIQCELSSCEIGKYVENKTCSCKDCPTLFSDCLECDNTKCTKCKQTHYIKEGKCEICPTDKICDGINAYDRSYCDNPPVGYFCDGNTPKRCKDKYNGYCATCNSTQCTSCDYGYYLSGNECKRCGTACEACIDANHCTRCQGNWILDTNQHKCVMPCSDAIVNCMYCSNASVCTHCFGGYYVNSLNRCSPCSDIPNCFLCSNGSTCTKCNKGYYVNSSNKCTLCAIANCAQCNNDGTCASCNQGFHVSSDKKSCVDNDNKFNCSDSNFMQIGNLCVTRKNMGDSTILPIPTSVVAAKAGSDYCYSRSQKCCWKGQTTIYCDSNYGGYDGCTRTVCNWEAAKEICSKFNYGGKIWRLPTKEEMSNWGYYSINLEQNGLMLCDTSSGYFSARCADAQRCNGAHDNYCNPNIVWSGSLSGPEYAYRGDLYAGVWQEPVVNLLLHPFSVRCVTEMK